MRVCSLLISAAFLLAPAAQAAAPTEADRALAKSMLTELVAIRSAKGQGNVPKLIDALAARFKAAGFTDADIIRVPVTIAGEQTSGLIVRYAGSGQGAAKPIAFLGHMDVVDALPENWTGEPFTLTERDGYWYGRGASDNKAGVTLLSATFMRLKQSGYVPNRDLLLAFSGDEETGMLTTRALLAHPLIKSVEYALNSDAGGGSIDADGRNATFAMQSAEKTTATFTLTASNPGGHSSAPRADNAIYELADALKAVQAYRFPVEFNEITRDTVARMAKQRGGELGTALTALLANPADAAARAIVDRYPSDANILGTTCVATMLNGGTAFNALPPSAVGTVNCRIMPGTPVAAVKAALQGAVGEKIVIAEQGESVESPISPLNPTVLAALRKAAAVNYPGATLEPSMSSGGTDGREFRRVGIPTYGAGTLAVTRPDDTRAHGKDERVPIASFYKELGFWDALIRALAGGGR